MFENQAIFTNTTKRTPKNDPARSCVSVYISPCRPPHIVHVRAQDLAQEIGETGVIVPVREEIAIDTMSPQETQSGIIKEKNMHMNVETIETDMIVEDKGTIRIIK
jgi:hypothetical protein